MRPMSGRFSTLFVIGLAVCVSDAAKLQRVSPVDDRCIKLHFADGEVVYNWDDTTSGFCGDWGPWYTEPWADCNTLDEYRAFGSALNATNARRQDSYTISSSTDQAFGTAGKRPLNAHLKSKPWGASATDNTPAMHHWVFLELPSPMLRDHAYTIGISSGLNTDKTSYDLTFNEFQLESPAIRISNIGYDALATYKCADVYQWMGNGGGRDFSRYEGNSFHLVNAATLQKELTGVLQFHLQNSAEPFDGSYYDFTKASVWDCDFSSFSGIGTYRLVIEGIGCSDTFRIGVNNFEEAFRVSMQGMFYQRMGCEKPPAGGFPRSRRPLFMQGVDPVNFTVRISTLNMVTGENPDNRTYYGSSLSGATCAASWGGWSDAYDNDQRPLNFKCVFDILLPYYLNPSMFGDGQLYIPETGNGIPDIIDEALWEIDWWLRLRDPSGGYLTGLTNIKPPETVNYAGAACAWHGWCVAAACAMAADCFRIGGFADRERTYRDSAVAAFNWASRQSDPMYTTAVSDLMGRDLRMTAAAFLYNLTGETKYEDIVENESMVSDGTARIRRKGSNQLFATVAYLLSDRPIHYPALRDDMRAALINQAKGEYVDKMAASPTKAARLRHRWEGQCQTSNEMAMVAAAHRLCANRADSLHFETGLFSEAEWTLGRNPMGLVQMTGLSSRAVTQTFAPGRRDGHPGVTPGWTPFMCRDGWKNSDHIVRCMYYTNRCFPTDKTAWPWGEHFWNSRYCVPNSEATPQQTFSQKLVLYGYLCSLTKGLAARTGVLPDPQGKQRHPPRQHMRLREVHPTRVVLDIANDRPLEPAKFAAYRLQGRKLVAKPQAGPPGSVTIGFPKPLSAGTYLVTWRHAAGQSCVRFVIQSTP